MPSTAYMSAPAPINLTAKLGETKDETPSIDLHWEPFQAHIEAFLRAIDRYSTQAKTEIADLASGHSSAVRDINAAKEETERRINNERDNEEAMLKALEKERETLSDMTASVSRLQASLSKVKDQSTSLDAELSSVKKDANTRRKDQEGQIRDLEDMKARDEAELRGLEAATGLRIEGIRESTLLLRYTLLDPSDPDREFALTVDVSNTHYIVPSCSPHLPSLQEHLRQLNSDRNFFNFVRQVRKSFKTLVADRPGQSQFDGLPGLSRRASHGPSAIGVA